MINKRSFILGFQGAKVPSWLREFAKAGCLEGVILFDYSIAQKNYQNNILGYNQLKELTQEIHELPNRPKIYIDQEGGKVRRLKETLGFQPLVGHYEYAKLPKAERVSQLTAAFAEMSDLGVDVNLGPVIDINYDALSGDIGIYGRSFSERIEVVKECAQEWIQVAQKFKIELCLKHFPGLGRAQSNSHHALTSLEHLIDSEQINLFFEILPLIPGSRLLVSHATHPQWSDDTGILPMSISRRTVDQIRSHFPTAVLVTDDIQMRALLDIISLKEACLKALANGVDLICIGNNLYNHEDQMLSLIDMAETRSL